ncbi:MAG: site-specific DNA-methyltransferase [Gammaproteobacteria bacterium AqS3]|nr:site-specific DNA-methyltransferase [Gammaproteobacteria bacterium AqS3]
MFIEGDNLDVLRLLQKSYRSKVKVIYIDPPYNTGNDGFTYGDTFSEPENQYLRAIGALDEDGVRQVSELQDGLKGRFHAGWLNMMYPRLKLARELLTDDGVIFISIDDNEQANLKLLCDEIFGEDNFVAQLIWENKEGGGGGDSKHFRIKHEYVLVYAKTRAMLSICGVEIEDQDRYKYSDAYESRRGKYQLVKLDSASIQQSESLKYVIEHEGEQIRPNGCWRWSKAKYKWGIENGFIVIKKGRNRKLSVYSKQYLKVDNEDKPIDRTKRPMGVISKYSTTQSNREIQDLFGKMVFKYSKPYQLIYDLIKICTTKDDLILDFFAGSATTAHSVMMLNAQVNGQRRFLLVQLSEPVSKKRAGEAYAYCAETLDTLEPRISDIAKQRIRLAGEKIKREISMLKIDLGFRVFKVAGSIFLRDDEKKLMETKQGELLRYTTDLKREDFDSLIYEVVLHTGVMLDEQLRREEVGGGNYPIALCTRRCYCVTEGLTQDIVQEIIDRHGDEFDTLFYLGDCLAPTVSYAEIEAAIKLAEGDKSVKALNFY